MQAASRESYLNAREQLETFVTGADAATVTKTADEVLAFASVLSREPRLRRALSDPARTGAERAELVKSLLSGKVSENAGNLLGVLASGRWSSPAQLLDGVERIGVDLLLAAADRAGDLAEVEDELFRFGKIVSGDVKLASAVSDGQVPFANREQLVTDLLGAKAKPATVRLAQQAVRGLGGRGFEGSLTRLVELAAERREAQIAYVTVAEPLTESEENRLSASLGRIYGRQVSVKVSVEPSVLGGMSVRVGSDLFDGTVARRLATVRNALVAK